MINLNNRDLCENCFQPLADGAAPCPHCGFAPSLVANRQPLALPISSILIGKYVVGDILGMGGFGITYLAYDVKQDRRVAIKEYYPASLASRYPGRAEVLVLSGEKGEEFKKGARKFYEEAELVSNFTGNPNLINVYEFFYQNNTAYYAMEYLDGEDLVHYLKTEGRGLSTGKLLFLLEKVSDALGLIHANNVLHRDITPDNIFVCKDGGIKLIDFGAARHYMTQESQSMSVILKEGFAPIEQYQKNGKQGPWTDIYALGATCYYMLTGKKPTGVFDRMQNDTLDFSNVNVELARVLRAMLSIQPERRPQNVYALKAILQKIPIVRIPLMPRQGAAGGAQYVPPVIPVPPVVPVPPMEPIPPVAPVPPQMPLEPQVPFEPQPPFEPQMPLEPQPPFEPQMPFEPQAPIPPEMPMEPIAPVPEATFDTPQEIPVPELGNEPPVPIITPEERGMSEEQMQAIQDQLLENALRSLDGEPTPDEGSADPAMSDPASSAQKPGSKKKKTLIGLLVAVLAVLAVASVGVVYFFVNNQPTDPTEVPSPDEFTDGTQGGAEAGSLQFVATGNTYAVGGWVPGDNTKITIPSTFDGKAVTSIAAGAFAGTEITSVSIPDSITSIGNEAFQGCSGITKVMLPTKLKTIGKNAFRATGLTMITIPETVTSIGSMAFADCKSLKSLNFNAVDCGVEGGSSSVFQNSPLATVKFGNKVEVIPKSLLGDGNAFKFESVVLPASVTTVEANAFRNCTKLKSVTVSAGLKTVGNGAFEGCTSLATVDYAGSSTQWNKISIGSSNGCLTGAISFGEAETLTFALKNGTYEVTGLGADASTDVIIPSTYNGKSVTRIAAYAFEGTDITSVIIPGSVTAIGDGAFQNCESLTRVTLSEGLKTIGAGAFAETRFSSITIPDTVTTIGQAAFLESEMLTSVRLPSNLKEIPAQAFRETPLTSISIPDSVTSIGVEAFYDCSALKTARLPDELKTIGQMAFAGTAITSLTIPESVTSIGANAFVQCESLKSVIYNAANCTPAWYNASSNTAYCLFSDCPLSSVAIGSSVKTIPAYLFADATSSFTFKSVKIPDSVTKIEDAAFYQCAKLTSIKMSKNIKTIGDGAFEGCDALKTLEYDGTKDQRNSISIGDGNSSLQSLLSPVKLEFIIMRSSASYGVKASGTYDVGTEIVIPSTHNGMPVTYILDGAFQGANIKSVQIPSSVTVIGNRAFANCTYLEKIEIPTSVTQIGNDAFNGCKKVATLTIPETITALGQNAFANCTSLKVVYYNAINCSSGGYSVGSSFYPVFAGTPIELLYIGAKVSKIPANLFNPGNSNPFKFTAVTIPSGVKVIERMAFANCTNLSTVNIAANVHTIEEGAFHFNKKLTVNYGGSSSKWETINIGDYNEALENIRYNANVK